MMIQSQGVGGITDLTCAQATQELRTMPSWQQFFLNPWYVYVKSVADSCQTIPNVYQNLQYGNVPVPKPSTTLSPAAPKTQEQMTVPGAWPYENSQIDLSKYTEEQRAAIQDAINRGEYNPQGNLTMFDILTLGQGSEAQRGIWDKYKGYIIVASIVGGIWLLSKAAMGGARVYGTYRGYR